MEITEVLSEARRRSGLTIRQLAQRARTSHSAVAAYESGARAPNSATLMRLLEACGFAISSELVPISPFEDRAARGREIVRVLDLAGRFPAEHGRTINGRFGSP